MKLGIVAIIIGAIFLIDSIYQFLLISDLSEGLVVALIVKLIIGIILLVIGVNRIRKVKRAAQNG